jgi:hypothetical protein
MPDRTAKPFESRVIPLRLFVDLSADLAVDEHREVRLQLVGAAQR